MALAFLVISICCHPNSTARSRAIKVVGVAITTWFCALNSMSEGSASRAALNSASLGKKQTTKSGAFSNCFQ